jgi:integrase
MNTLNTSDSLVENKQSSTDFKSLTRNSQYHMHKFERQGNYNVCDCGKKILFFEAKGDIKIGLRDNGKPYTKKSDTNRFLKPQEWQTLEDSFKMPMKHSCRCLLHTGARITEIRKAQVRDFIYNPSGRSTLVLRHTKTKARKGEFGSGKPRTIPLSKQFAKYLYNYIIEHELKPEDGFKIHTPAAIGLAMKENAEKIGLSHPEDFSPHNLRKTFETWLMALGVQDSAVVAHLGHDLKTAMSHYVSPDIFSWNDKKEIRSIIGDIYENKY